MTQPNASNILADPTESRPRLVRRGVLLNYATIVYNSLEAIVSLIAGAVSGSPALTGFGFDSLIEVTSAGASQWRLRMDHTDRRERVEHLTRRIVGWSFIALAMYIAYQSGATLWKRERPERTIVGIMILALSIIVMPWLARRKRRVAVALGSRALEAEATQTSLCAYLSAIALGGVALNAMLGWWWADPVAALAMCPIIVHEGIGGVRRETPCGDCA